MEIRKFNLSDAEEISKLVYRNLLEVNSKDYGKEKMIAFAKDYNSNKILKIATNGNMYVACEKDTIIGCGAITYSNPLKDECMILTLFILPEYHNKGIGKKIIKILENDSISLTCKKILVNASLTSNLFYEKMGYNYKNNKKIPYFSECYQMEKILIK